MRRRLSFRIAAAAFLAGMASPALGEGPPAEELANIRNLSGCFEVTYTFVEDGERDTLAKGEPLGPITEWVGYATASDGAITLTHVSITADGKPVPHWHEVWRYHQEGETWSQEVRRGAPGKEAKELRYRCTAPWTVNRWQCHAGTAPKPFRDSGAPFGFARTDYDRIDRENILLVTPEGWIHNEHNRKMTDAGAVVSYELGWIEYRRIDAAKCAAARADFPREAQ